MRVPEFCAEGQRTHTLLLSFTLDPVFFEAVALRRLEIGGAQRVLVLADAHEALARTAEAAADLRQIGRSWTLGAVRVKGSFHPKLIARFSKKDAAVAVLSGNITPSGWGRNLEVGSHWLVGASRLTGQHGTGCVLGIDGVTLAFLVSELPVGATHLNDNVALLAQEAGQPGAIRAGALDADRPDGAERIGPGLKRLVALAAGQNCRGGKLHAECANRDGGVGVLVGVDANDDIGQWCFADWISRAVHGPDDPRADRTVTGRLPSSSYEATFRGPTGTARKADTSTQ